MFSKSKIFCKSWINVLFVLCLCVMVSVGCKGPKPKVDDTTSVIPEKIDEPTGTRLPERDEGDMAAISGTKFENVLFSYDSFQVTETELAKIQKVAELMKAKTAIKLTTEGNCDERGSAEYNMSLGEHRALAVRAALVVLGIDASRIQTKSYGREKPIDNRHCEEAWHQNRRVEFAPYLDNAPAVQ
jgi:peptidoglycan-associated lipoprotein